jgi:hypothetical protein
MKVIFLDHDGVICLSDNWGNRFKKQKSWGGRKLSMSTLSMPVEYRFDNFDEKAVKVLNEILEETGAEIVVSSDWKNWATLKKWENITNQKVLSKNQLLLQIPSYMMTIMISHGITNGSQNKLVVWRLLSILARIR